MPTRTVTLYSLKDANVCDIVDDGVSGSAGNVVPHKGRAQLERMLALTVPVDGADVPVFCVRDAPAALYHNDPIDKVLVEHTVTPYWADLRQRFIAQHEERKARTRRQLEDKQAREVALTLAPLLKHSARVDEDGEAKKPKKGASHG